MISYLKY